MADPNVSGDSSWIFDAEHAIPTNGYEVDFNNDSLFLFAARHHSKDDSFETERDDSLDDDDDDENQGCITRGKLSPILGRRRVILIILITLGLAWTAGLVVGILSKRTSIFRSNDSEPASTTQTGSSSGGTNTASPTQVPTETSTTNPTLSPTDVPATLSPTMPTTMAPTSEDDEPLLNLLKSISPNGLTDPTSPQYHAYLWLLNQDLLTNADTDPIKLQQRYAVVTLYHALGADLAMNTTALDECNWPTIECSSQASEDNVFVPEEVMETSYGIDKQWRVSEINMARKSLNGSLPPEIGLLSSSMVTLDLAENDIGGSIPEELYELSNLQYLYLHQNKMTGTLSESIDNLQLLEELYLGSNQLSGSIPYNIGSRRDEGRPLRYLILYDNQLQGNIPEEMKLREMFHLDFSFNKLTGTLPADLGDDFRSLKHLYLDHNELTGTIPESYSMVGRGRLYVLSLNDNQLTGGVPSNWTRTNLHIDTITVQNNDLTEPIDKSICRFSVHDFGEMVELGADCDICTCKDLCDGYCY